MTHEQDTPPVQDRIPDRHTELATVHSLPTRPDDTEVVDGEILTNEEYAHLTSQKAKALARYQGYCSDAVATARVVRTIATHDRTATVAKALVRHGSYPFGGAKVVFVRVWEAKTNSRYERMMRTFEVAGDWDKLADWEARSEQARDRRHRRRMDWLAAPVRLIKAVVVAAVSLIGFLLVVGIVLAVANKDFSDVVGPITALLDLIRWVVWVVTIAWLPMVVSAPWVVVGTLWNIGRKHTEPLAWAAPANESTSRDLVPDEGAILSALRNLNLAPLNRKFKEGWKPRWVLGTGRDGKGWRTQVELPPGVTVEMINDKKAVLAHNLVRLPVEVWPTEPKKQPGVLDLWVADQGILTGPVEPYPLLDEGTADYFTGVPVGIDQRGDEVVAKLMASNYAIAGIMGSGKTSLVINLLCGAMLDPLVDIDVYVMAFNVDYDPMRPRLRTLVKGDEDEHITAAMDALRALRGEVTNKGKILSELGGEETKLTRELAQADPRMRPKVVVFDECQELFRHERYGEEAKQLAIKVMMKARKCGITLVFVTPAPSADSLPRDLAKTVSHRVCFAIGDHQGNDAILGTGAHKQGITATTLVAGEDIGTAMASGFAARPGLLRTHHIRKQKGVDEITPIVQRALDERTDAHLSTPPALNPADEVDHLADIREVLGTDKRLRTQQVIGRLEMLRPSEYEGWTFSDLTSALAEYGITPVKSNGVMNVRADDITNAITERDENGDVEDDDTAGN
jgi:S-DNA-T family DNA segregation ATPase FtsK/SpoIIIE